MKNVSWRGASLTRRALPAFSFLISGVNSASRLASRRNIEKQIRKCLLFPFCSDVSFSSAFLNALLIRTYEKILIRDSLRMPCD